MPYPQNSDTEQVFTAGHLLISMRNGAANDRATVELEKLVQAVMQTGKSGDVTIKIKVSKLKDGDTEQKVDIVVKSSIPVGDIPAGIYYPNDDGSLHRTDPRQLSMLDRDREQDERNNERNLAGVGRGRVIDGEFARG